MLSTDPPPAAPTLPARPLRRPAPCRWHTCIFWTVFVLFVAVLGYVGLLAFTGDNGPVLSGAAVHSHRLAECLVALCAIAAVSGAVVSKHHVR